MTTNTLRVIQYIELIGNREDIESDLRNTLTKTDTKSINFKRLEIHPALRIQLTKILIDEGVITSGSGGNTIDTERAREFFDSIDSIKLARDYPWPPKHRRPLLFASPPELIPRSLAAEIDDIKNLLTELVSNTKESLTILSPYTTSAALSDILKPLLINKHAENIKIEVYIANPLEDARRQAKTMQSLLHKDLIKKVSYYYRAGENQEDSILHAKLLIVDNERGYLGSANFTEQGLTRHFELGVEMSGQQARLSTELLKQLVLKKVFQPLDSAL
jgi:phosphatidylserine/phosphatidylglycerophosphate/cardiolipin synthase-like enzyme